jgi:hypothetical protein
MPAPRVAPAQCRQPRGISTSVRRAMLLLLTVLLTSCAGGQALPSPTATGDPRVPFVNVRVSHDRYHVHAEPSLAVNPQDPRNLLAVAQVFDTMPDRAPATFVSFDGGASWQDNDVLPLPGTSLTGTNLTVAFTPHGVGIVVGRLDGPTTTGIFAWRSDDGGRHFHAPVALVTGSPNTINVDHPWLAVAPTDGSPGSAVYDVWSLMGTMARQTVGAIMFTRSLDLGQTFEPAVPISGARPLFVAGPAVVAGPNGHIAMFYLDYGAFNGQIDAPHDLQRAPVRVVISSDGGKRFARPQTIGEARVGSPATPFATPKPSSMLPTEPCTSPLQQCAQGPTIQTSSCIVHPTVARRGSVPWTSPPLPLRLIPISCYQKWPSQALALW